MDVLIQQVAAKAGISEEQARQAVETVMAHLRDKLPAPMATQLDSLMSGGAGLEQAGNVAKGLGGLFGKQ